MLFGKENGLKRSSRDPNNAYFAYVKLSEKNKDFFNNVFDVVKLIPPGRVTSYGAIANYLGSPRSSRMVGWAMNAAAGRPDIPAHRVVNRNGLLTGKNHFGYQGRMAELLINEGVDVKDDQVVNFKREFWNPSEELDF